MEGFSWSRKDQVRGPKMLQTLEDLRISIHDRFVFLLSLVERHGFCHWLMCVADS